jgi:hydrogenase maturation protein HypF
LKAITFFLKKENITPEIILCDLHPHYRTTLLAENLSQKYQANLYQIQHHVAHVFSAYGEWVIENKKIISASDFFGIACDGTGLGLDGNVWGGEVFEISKKLNIKRIARLENQTMIGGDLAVREPARILISVLDKINKNSGQERFDIYQFVKKYYNKSQFKILYNQLQENFNCSESSSTGRVLDAIALLLGFVGNQRAYKHEAIDSLERNSSEFHFDVTPQIRQIKIDGQVGYELLTMPLYEYLLANFDKNKARLATTAQIYLAQGLLEIIALRKKPKNLQNAQLFFAGGMANNVVIANYFETRGVVLNQKIPRGDGGISFGQIMFFLLANPRNQFSRRHVDRAQTPKFRF